MLEFHEKVYQPFQLPRLLGVWGAGRVAHLSLDDLNTRKRRCFLQRARMIIRNRILSILLLSALYVLSLAGKFFWVDLDVAAASLPRKTTLSLVSARFSFSSYRTIKSSSFGSLPHFESNCRWMQLTHGCAYHRTTPNHQQFLCWNICFFLISACHNFI